MTEERGDNQEASHSTNPVSFRDVPVSPAHSAPAAPCPHGGWAGLGQGTTEREQAAGGPRQRQQKVRAAPNSRIMPLWAKWDRPAFLPWVTHSPLLSARGKRDLSTPFSFVPHFHPPLARACVGVDARQFFVSFPPSSPPFPCHPCRVGDFWTSRGMDGRVGELRVVSQYVCTCSSLLLGLRGMDTAGCGWTAAELQLIIQDGRGQREVDRQLITSGGEGKRWWCGRLRANPRRYL